MALLVVFAGLPGSGKSLLSRGVAEAIGATYLRIDSIESAVVTEFGTLGEGGVGYEIANRVAADQLVAGRDVVADAVNGVAIARDGWVTLAKRTGAALRLVEVWCSDTAEHRRRVESREATMTGQHLPSWDEVTRREFEPWPPELADGLVVVDNLGDPAEHVARIVSALRSGT